MYVYRRAPPHGRCCRLPARASSRQQTVPVDQGSSFRKSPRFLDAEVDGLGWQSSARRRFALPLPKQKALGRTVPGTCARKSLLGYAYSALSGPSKLDPWTKASFHRAAEKGRCGVNEGKGSLSFIARKSVLLGRHKLIRFDR